MKTIKLIINQLELEEQQWGPETPGHSQGTVSLSRNTKTVSATSPFESLSCNSRPTLSTF